MDHVTVFSNCGPLDLMNNKCECLWMDKSHQARKNAYSPVKKLLRATCEVELNTENAIKNEQRYILRSWGSISNRDFFS